MVNGTTKNNKDKRPETGLRTFSYTEVGLLRFSHLGHLE